MRRGVLRREALALESPRRRSRTVARLERSIAATSQLEMLVNNAGFGVGGTFREGAIARHQQMLDVHVTATTRLTQAALAGMTARERGAIINTVICVIDREAGGAANLAKEGLVLRPLFTMSQLTPQE